MRKRFSKLLFLTVGGLTLCGSLHAQLILNQPNTSGAYTAPQSITLSPGFSTTPGQTFSAIITQGCTPLATSLSNNQNYIVTYTPRVAGITNPADPNNTTCQVMATVQYFDGLGRSLQVVGLKASPTFRDLVTPIAYDAFGREDKRYLPYSGTVASSNGSYKASALTEQAGFYTNPTNVTGWNAPGVVPIPGAAFSKTVFEASPLNRVQEQGAPGAVWQPSASRTATAGRTAAVEFGTNNSLTTYATTGFAVRLYSAVPVTTAGRTHERTLSGTGYYSASQLHLTIIKDENWTSADGKAGTNEEYKDKEGRVVLRRMFNKNGATIETLSTYYVYDDLGNLSFVLPPGANPDAVAVPAQATLDNFCYQYRYDGRKRLIEKKLPGKGWEYMVYNKLDQLVASQDALQRGKSVQEWLFSKYDAFGRVIQTGICTYPASTANTSYRAALQTTIDAQLSTITLWESRAPGAVYSNQCWPTTGITTVLSWNYYDNYAIPGLPAVSPFNLSGSYSTMIKTLLTASQVNILGTTQMLWTVNYYDNEARVVRNIKQHYKGAAVSNTSYDDVSCTYSFTDEVLTTTRRHYVNGTEQLYLANRFTYDHQGRPKDNYQKTGDNATTTNAEILLSRKNYNEVGQLTSKQLYSTNLTTPVFAQTITYAYNPRGWLKSQTAPLFTQNLKYDDVISGVVSQFNGNISRQEWAAGKYYNYTYDKLNRLNSAISNDSNNELIGYDVMGNINRLQRKQAGTLVDQLKYTYTTGNRLTSVLDSTTTSTNSAFQLAGKTGYSYDLNGNMISRSNAASTANNLTAITYNYLNLPTGLNAGAAAVSYTYDATGNKLRKQVASASINNEYINGIQYEAGALKYVFTAEGRVVRNSATNYSYEYTMTDHLGNGRMYFDINAGIARKIQETDYYAFGLDIQKSLSGTENKYQYNGKEKQDQEKLYDYGARFYDPVIGKWNVMDPLAEKYVFISPYVYVANNPIRLIDPNGMEIVGDVDQVEKLKRQAEKRIASETKRQERLQSKIDKRSASGKSTSGLEQKLAQSKSMSGEMNGMLSEISAMEKSDQVYNVVTNYTGKDSDGEARYNSSTGAVDVMVSSNYLNNGGLAHELTHAYQFETGAIDFAKGNGGPGALYDITDEISAYRRQFALTENNVTVTEGFVRGLRNQSGNPLYNSLPGGNLNKNSSLMMISIYNRGIPLSVPTVLQNPSSRYVDVSSTYFSNFLIR